MLAHKIPDFYRFSECMSCSLELYSGQFGTKFMINFSDFLPFLKNSAFGSGFRVPEHPLISDHCALYNTKINMNFCAKIHRFVIGVV